MEKFSLRELTKRGFIRKEEKDFTDDGCRFKYLEYKGLEISYTKDYDEYFLSIRIPYSGDNYIYDDYCNEEWYRNCDKYNGVSSVDADDVVKICETALKEIKKLESQPKENIDTTEMEKRRLYEIEYAQEVIDDFKNSNVIWEINSKYEVERIMDYCKSLQEEVNHLRDMTWGSMEYTELKEKRNFYQKYGYIEFEKDEDDFYIRELKEAMAKYYNQYIKKYNNKGC